MQTLAIYWSWRLLPNQRGRTFRLRDHYVMEIDSFQHIRNGAWSDDSFKSMPVLWRSITRPHIFPAACPIIPPLTSPLVCQSACQPVVLSASCPLIRRSAHLSGRDLRVCSSVVSVVSIIVNIYSLRFSFISYADDMRDQCNGNIHVHVCKHVVCMSAC